MRWLTEIRVTGEDPMLSDQQQYRYMTVDDMKSLGDDSLKIDVTRDERGDHLRDSIGELRNSISSCDRWW